MYYIPRVFSSAVEHGIADLAVAGSIPAAPFNFLIVGTRNASENLCWSN